MEAKSANQRGVAIVEMALIIPLLLMLLFIVAEFGRAVIQYNTLTKAVRDGARYLSIQLPNTKTTEAKNLVVYGNTAGTGDPVVAGLTTSHVSTPTWQPSVGTIPEITIVTVEITGFTFTPMVSSVFGMVIGPIQFSDISATMRSLL